VSDLVNKGPEESNEMKVKSAREALGVSQTRFASFIGRNASLVNKRERGDAVVPHHAFVQAQIVLVLVASLGADAVIETLDAVPADQRSEVMASTVLMLLAAKRRLMGLVQEALAVPAIVADDESELAEESGKVKQIQVKGSRDVIDAIKRGIQEDVVDAAGEEREYLDRAVEALGNASHALWVSEALRRRRESKEESDDGGGGG